METVTETTKTVPVKEVKKVRPLAKLVNVGGYQAPDYLKKYIDMELMNEGNIWGAQTKAYGLIEIDMYITRGRRTAISTYFKMVKEKMKKELEK